VCNWMNCTQLGYTSEQCESECLASDKSDYFCGLCEDGLECLEFPELNSKEKCENSEACVFGQQADLLTEVKSHQRYNTQQNI